MNVTLRPVVEEDLEPFFVHQADRGASAMAAFPSRSRPAHYAHWRRVLRDALNVSRTIVVDGVVAGNMGSWPDDQRRFIGYWLAREFWGRGVATAALGLFLAELSERPLYAHVVAHNTGSIRVLEKNGFEPAAEQPGPAPDGVEERLYRLR